MAGTPAPADADLDDGPEESGAARIADPENYNLRRRLKQLHDAKERVRNTADAATRAEMTDRQFSDQKRNRLVAEAVSDYILELKSVLNAEERAEEFLEEKVGTVNDVQITLSSLSETRGLVDAEDGRVVVPYQASMSAWSICNDYFETVAGAEFEEGMDTESGFDTTGSA